MFFSSCDRDLGVAFKIHLGNQAPSLVEAKNSSLLSSCDGYLLEPFEWPKGSQATCGVVREDSELLSRPCRKEGLHLAMTGEPRGFSRFLAGFSSYDGESRSLSCGAREEQSPFELRVGAGHCS